MTVKQCSQCGLVKDKSDFYKNGPVIRANCKACHNANRTSSGTVGTVGTSGTPVEKKVLSGKSGDSLPPLPPLPAISFEVVDEFAIEFADEMSMTAVKMYCPVCNKTEYLFYATLYKDEGARTCVDFAICNTCSIDREVRFFDSDEGLFLVKKIDLGK